MSTKHPLVEISDEGEEDGSKEDGSKEDEKRTTRSGRSFSSPGKDKGKQKPKKKRKTIQASSADPNLLDDPDLLKKKKDIPEIGNRYIGEHTGDIIAQQFTEPIPAKFAKDEKNKKDDEWNKEFERMTVEELLNFFRFWYPSFSAVMLGRQHVPTCLKFFQPIILLSLCHVNNGELQNGNYRDPTFEEVASLAFADSMKPPPKRPYFKLNFSGTRSCHVAKSAMDKFPAMYDKVFVVAQRSAEAAGHGSKGIVRYDTVKKYLNEFYRLVTASWSMAPTLIGANPVPTQSDQVQGLEWILELVQREKLGYKNENQGFPQPKDTPKTDEDHCVANPYGADTIINDNRNRFIKKVTLNSVVEVLAEGEGSAVRKPFHDRSGHIVYEFPATPEDDEKAQEACVSFYFANCKGRYPMCPNENEQKEDNIVRLRTWRSLERNDAEEFMGLVPPMALLRSLEEHKVIQEQLTEFYDSVDSLYQPPPSADIPEKAKWKVEITLKNELVWKLPLEHSSGNELVGIELVSAVWQLDQNLKCLLSPHLMLSIGV
ncbi:hypothetical protein SEMRO_3352_G347110.1 [Seminavis robusta]|uniref:Uncharacterized protein n=1 Tax=Seminavis robusta TaxID=568900 RepID=A0A9N8F4A5_9STRA|nr:hypothetical protein SEMRO_3352_G347110.1 [Seminavis robusta]|eukprot:Sro3352_g347110.1 n/a (543) ;mRNA; r:19-1647